jgi:hypothetical protein
VRLRFDDEVIALDRSRWWSLDAIALEELRTAFSVDAAQRPAEATELIIAATDRVHPSQSR